MPWFVTIAAVVVGGPLVLLGGLALGGSGVAAVVVAAGLAACLGASMSREAAPGLNRRGIADAASRSAAWTAGVLLALSGTVALVGGPTTTLLAGLGAILGLGAWLVHSSRQRPRRPGSRAVAVAPPPDLPDPTSQSSLDPSSLDPSSLDPSPLDPSSLAPLLPAVATMSTEALGREWLRTAGALGHQLDPATRQCVVRRREHALDELERRDPAGFARWLADGAGVGGDPARYVRDEPTSGVA